MKKRHFVENKTEKFLHILENELSIVVPKSVKFIS
jgi:hypothetical protein